MNAFVTHDLMDYGSCYSIRRCGLKDSLTVTVNLKVTRRCFALTRAFQFLLIACRVPEMRRPLLPPRSLFVGLSSPLAIYKVKDANDPPRQDISTLADASHESQLLPFSATSAAGPVFRTHKTNKPNLLLQNLQRTTSSQRQHPTWTTC